MNIVDGIFSSQLGVKISLAPSVIFTSASDPFTKSKASDLLTEVRNFRRGSASQLALGLTHLPALAHIAIDGTVMGSAEGWDPVAWRDVTEGARALADALVKEEAA